MKYLPSGSGKIIEKPDYLKQIMFEQKDFSSPGHTLQIVTNQAGKTLHAHFHKKQTEVGYILDGQATWTVNGKTYEMKQGDAVIIEPNDIHEIANPHQVDCHVLIFKSNLPPDGADYYEAP